MLLHISHVAFYEVMGSGWPPSLFNSTRVIPDALSIRVVGHEAARSALHYEGRPFPVVGGATVAKLMIGIDFDLPRFTMVDFEALIL